MSRPLAHPLRRTLPPSLFSGQSVVASPIIAFIDTDSLSFSSCCYCYSPSEAPLPLHWSPDTLHDIFIHLHQHHNLSCLGKLQVQYSNIIMPKLDTSFLNILPSRCLLDGSVPSRRRPSHFLITSLQHHLSTWSSTFIYISKSVILLSKPSLFHSRQTLRTSPLSSKSNHTWSLSHLFLLALSRLPSLIDCMHSITPSPNLLMSTH